jgi:hypothetical protein
MGVLTNKRLAAQISRHIELSVRDAERRSPEAVEKRARIRARGPRGQRAVKSRERAEKQLTAALRRLVGEGLSIRASAEKVGVTYQEARMLVRRAEVADAIRGNGVGGLAYAAVSDDL